MEASVAQLEYVVSNEGRSKELAKYLGPHKNTTIGRTFLGRNYLGDRRLRHHMRKMMEERNLYNPNLLYVGSGRTDPEWGCASGPIELAGICEGLGMLDYRETVLDIYRKNLDSSKKLDKIFTIFKRNMRDAQGDQSNSADALIQYLRDTNPAKLAEKRYERIRIMSSEYTEADVSEMFRSKKKDGDVKFVRGDIVTYPGGGEKFDVVHSMNLLYHQTRWEYVTLGLYNMSKLMNPGAVALVDDVKIGEFSKWRNMSYSSDTKLIDTEIEGNIQILGDQLKLKILEKIPTDFDKVNDDQNYLILQKTA